MSRLFQVLLLKLQKSDLKAPVIHAEMQKRSLSFFQIAEFITYKAERAGITVERVDPVYTSQECPACGKHNRAQDRAYRCSECGWRGHRDAVGAVAISRRTGLCGHSTGAPGA